LAIHSSPLAVSPAADRSLLAQGHGERQEITVLFAAPHGFPTLMDNLPPDRLLHILNHHLSAVVDAVLEERGTPGGFTDHAVMAFFNAPVRQEDHALRAVRAALKAREAVQKTLSANGPNDQFLPFCFAVHTDTALIGHVGPAQYAVYTAVGHAVSLARHLLSLARPDQLLIGEKTLALVGDYVDAVPLGAVSIDVDGYTKKMGVFNVSSLK